jgi:hypothetical protein
MAYYTALITEWATLTGTTAAKLAAINALTISGSVPTSITVTGNQLLNCINWAEFAALTPTQQANLLMLCAVPGPLLGGSNNTAFIVVGMILAYFTNHAGPTITALTALATATSQPWWQANGYSSPISPTDLVAAGGLT